MLFTSNKKNTTSILFFIALLILVLPFAVGAEEPTKSDVGGGIEAITKTIGATALAPIWAFLWVLLTAITWLIIVAQYALENVVQFNVDLLPIDMTIVQVGWATMRDLVNAFFILIILWIALTIVLNLEHLGGKKLLIRVIAIALLVNFSLALVTGLFAFTNQLTKQFQKVIPEDLSSFITNNTKFYQTFEALTEEAAEAAAKKNESSSTSQYSPSTKDKLFASLGAPPAYAADLKLSCFFSALSINPTASKCLGSTIVSWIGRVFERKVDEAFDQIYKSTLNLATGVVFSSLTLIVVLIGAILLILRIVAMGFLAIFAPLAFLAFVFPSGIAKTYWDQWLRNLFKWSFLGPVFIFLFYLSLLMLKTYNDAVNAKGVSDTIFATDRLTATIILAIFLLVSAWISLKFAGNIGKTAVGLARTGGMFAAGAATGGLAAAGAWSMRRWGRGAVERGSEYLSAPERSTFTRKVAAPITRSADRFLQDTRAVEEHKKEFSHVSDENFLKREYRRSTTAPRKAALALRLKELGKFGALEEREQQAALGFTSRYGMEREIQKARPDLHSSNPAEVIKFTRELKHNDIGNIEKDALKNKAVRTGLLLNANLSPAKLGQLYETDIDGMEGLVDEINELTKLVEAKNAKEVGIAEDQLANAQKNLESFKRRYAKYSESEMAKALGVRSRSEWKERQQGASGSKSNIKLTPGANFEMEQE